MIDDIVRLVPCRRPHGRPPNRKSRPPRPSTTAFARWSILSTSRQCHGIIFDDQHPAAGQRDRLEVRRRLPGPLAPAAAPPPRSRCAELRPPVRSQRTPGTPCQWSSWEETTMSPPSSTASCLLIGQSEPPCRRNRRVNRSVGLRERLEDPGDLLVGHPDPGVHHDEPPAAALPAPDSGIGHLVEVQPRAGWCPSLVNLIGVPEEVDQDLAQPRRVRLDRRPGISLRPAISSFRPFAFAGARIRR